MSPLVQGVLLFAGLGLGYAGLSLVEWCVEQWRERRPE